jgi:hypothetical protein
MKYKEGQISEPINTNKRVRQGCGLSPDLFSIYIKKAIGDWRLAARNGIQSTSGKIMQTIMYADVQVIIAKSDDELQVAVNEINKRIRKYDMKISHSKTEALRFFG